MAEIIRPKFDVLRGWPQGSAYDRHFDKVVDGSGAALKVRQGTIVTINSLGKATPATVTTNAAEFPLFMVVEGNDPSDSYSGDYLDKIVAIKGSYEVLLSETMFVAGSYAPGLAVTVVGGKVSLPGVGNVAVNGFVTGYDATSKELRVAFTL